MCIKNVLFGLFFMMTQWGLVLAHEELDPSVVPSNIPPVSHVVDSCPSLEFGTGFMPFPGVESDYYTTYDAPYNTPLSLNDRQENCPLFPPCLCAMVSSDGDTAEKCHTVFCCAVGGSCQCYAGKGTANQTDVCITSTLCNLFSCTLGHSESAACFCAPAALCSGPLCAVGKGLVGFGLSLFGLTYYLGTDAQRFGCYSPNISWDWCRVFDVEDDDVLNYTLSDTPHL